MGEMSEKEELVLTEYIKKFWHISDTNSISTNEWVTKFEKLATDKEKDKSIEELKSFVKEHDIKFPVTISEKENFEMAKNFNVKKIPESFLYGKSGLFLEKYVGIANEQNIINYIKNDIK